MILILSTPGDGPANRVEQKLRQRGANVTRFNPAVFPAEAALSVAYSPKGKVRTDLRINDATIDFDHVTSIWLRRPGLPLPHDTIPAGPGRDLVAQESRAVLFDAWHTLQCGWLPGSPGAVRDAQRKLSQLMVAGEVGFELPPTLVTTSPDDLIAFYREHNGAIISKLADIAFHQTLGREFARYTEIVSKRDMGYVDSVRYCPMIYQAYVPKRFELRVTVVGQEVFAAEIHSQESHHTKHDWRRYDDGQTPYRPHHLPSDLRQLCLRLTERLGLCYGAIDLVLTPDGRYVFLEINPAGQYLWIEDVTRLPISDAVCDLLIAGPPAVQSPAGKTYAQIGGIP